MKNKQNLDKKIYIEDDLLCEISISDLRDIASTALTSLNDQLCRCEYDLFKIQNKKPSYEADLIADLESNLLIVSNRKNYIEKKLKAALKFSFLVREYAREDSECK